MKQETGLNSKRVRLKELNDSPYIKNVTMDSLGHVTDCSVTAKVYDDNNNEKKHQGIAEDMKQAIIAVHPWKIIYLNGEYVAYALENYIIPYKFDY